MGDLWQEPAKTDLRTEFVFLSVDVIGHSKLFRGHLSNEQVNKNDRLLTQLREFVQACVPEFKTRQDLLWDWASDGGIFGFPSSEFRRPTTKNAIDCAIAICEGLSETTDDQIALHIALDRGDAFFVEEHGMRRSDALNTAAKLKSPTGQTAILVTQRIYDDLPPERAEDFRRQQETLEDGTAVYAYLPALQSGMRQLAVLHAAQEQWMAAAHCHYRHGRYLLAAGKEDAATHAFQEAITAIETVPDAHRHRYFYRTLRALYEAWLTLGVPCDYPAPRQFFARKDVQSLFATDEWPMRGNLLTHLELISEQLDLLCAKMLNSAGGLSTLETALLLQRAGYSPHYFGDALARRLDRVEGDMRANHYRSIDGDCSLCSGAALSALSLGGPARSERAHELREWLRLLGPYRYCILRRDYTDAQPHEHAMHYAANVLQGFLDMAGGTESRVDKEIEQDIADVVSIFFQSKDLDPRGFFVEWMRHRNVSAFEVCTYMLPPWIRYLLSGRPMTQDQREYLRTAVNILAGNLLGDAFTAEFPGRLYAARENVGSLALGLLVGMDENATKVVKHALGIFVRRAQSEYVERGSTTLDANLDRTRRFLEGWLLQWETALFARDQHVSMPAYVDDLLMTYSPPGTNR